MEQNSILRDLRKKQFEEEENKNNSIPQEPSENYYPQISSLIADDNLREEEKKQSESYMNDTISQRIRQLEQRYPNGLSYEPQPFQRIEEHESNLDIANMVESDKKKRESANHFVCAICAMVVIDSKECSSCSSLFCSACINPWRSNNESCPKKCQGNNAVEFNEIHRYVKQNLCDLIFKCNNSTCDFVGPYLNALIHLKECTTSFKQCVQECGLGILGLDMEYHCVIQCKNFHISCETCENPSFPNDSSRNQNSSHDCVQVLKKNLIEAREEINRLKDQLNGSQREYGSQRINQENGQIRIAQNEQQQLNERQLKCSNGCQLERVTGIIESYDGTPRCDVCRQTELNDFEYFYHCEDCQYDLCLVCASVTSGLFRTSFWERGQAIRGHECLLTYDANSDRQGDVLECDGPSLHENACASSENFNLQNQNQQFLTCQQHNLDVCIQCVMKYKS